MTVFERKSIARMNLYPVSPRNIGWWLSGTFLALTLVAGAGVIFDLTLLEVPLVVFAGVWGLVAIAAIFTIGLVVPAKPDPVSTSILGSQLLAVGRRVGQLGGLLLAAVLGAFASGLNGAQGESAGFGSQLLMSLFMVTLGVSLWIFMASGLVVARRIGRAPRRRKEKHVARFLVAYESFVPRGVAPWIVAIGNGWAALFTFYLIPVGVVFSVSTLFHV